MLRYQPWKVRRRTADLQAALWSERCQIGRYIGHKTDIDLGGPPPQRTYRLFTTGKCPPSPSHFYFWSIGSGIRLVLPFLHALAVTQQTLDSAQLPTLEDGARFGCIIALFCQHLFFLCFATPYLHWKTCPSSQQQRQLRIVRRTRTRLVILLVPILWPVQRCIQSQTLWTLKKAQARPSPIRPFPYSQAQKIFIVFIAALTTLIPPLTASIYYPVITQLAGDLHVSITDINLTITTYLVRTESPPPPTATLRLERKLK